MFAAVLTEQHTQREAPDKWRVDRAAEQGALNALSAGPGRPGKTGEQVELEEATAEIERLRAPVAEQAVARHLHEGKSRWGRPAGSGVASSWRASALGVRGDQGVAVGAGPVHPVQLGGHPQPGLVEAGHLVARQLAFDLAQEVAQAVGGAFGHGRDGALRHRIAEQLCQRLGGAFLRQELPPMQIQDDRGDPRPLGHRGGHRGGGLAAPGSATLAATRHQLALGHPHRHRHQVKHLTGASPPPAGRRSDWHHNHRSARAHGAAFRRDRRPAPASTRDGPPARPACVHSCGATTSGRVW